MAIANYIGDDARKTAPDVVVVELKLIPNDPGWFSVSIQRETDMGEDGFEIKYEAVEQRMTSPGARSRAEELAVQLGIPICMNPPCQ